MSATDRLNAMQQRCDAATEGPWEAEICAVAAMVYDKHGIGVSDDVVTDDDARFIAAARTDLPATIAALRAVLKVHAPLWTPSRGHYCQECGTPLTDDAPDCPTVRAITEALT